jgi:hypothetical protein
MFNFRCKVCAEKDARIKDLQQELNFLRVLTRPTYVSEIDQQMNKALEGAGMPMIELPASPPEAASVEQEFNAIVSGSF